MSSDNAKKTPLFHLVPSPDGDSPSLPFERNAAEGQAEACRLCFGTGVEVVPGKGARRCECRKRNSRDKLLEAARIPPRYSKCTLDSYRSDSYMPELSNGTQFRAYMKAKELANYYHSSYKEQGKGLLFMGPVGVGKTHLAVGILLSLIEQGVECLFYEFGSLLKSIQDSYNPISRTSELRVLSPVYESEVLVLDELGATMPTDWVRDTIGQIINRRYNDKKVTIFTTNYLDEVRYAKDSFGKRNDPVLERVQNEIVRLKASVPRNEDERRSLEQQLHQKMQFEKQMQAELESKYEQRIQGLTKLEERIGFSMRSRLHEMCETISIEGADYRRKPRRNDF